VQYVCQSEASVASSIASFNMHLRNDITGHSITLHVYYPSPLPSHPIPAMVFMHGWLGTWSDYPFIPNTLVPLGYVVALLGDLDSNPKAEPVELGSDQSFCLQTLLHESQHNASFPLFGRVSPLAVASGHSEGGAATFVAANQENLDPHPFPVNFSSIITLSGCFDGWDAIPYVKRDTVPAMLISASLDCICPPTLKAEPYFRAMPSSCKFFVNIKRGTHCNFCEYANIADYEFCHIAEEALLCEIGHSLLPASQQWDLTTKYSAVWMNYTLLQNVAALTELRDMLKKDNATGAIEYWEAC